MNFPPYTEIELDRVFSYRLLSDVQFGVPVPIEPSWGYGIATPREGGFVIEEEEVDHDGIVIVTHALISEVVKGGHKHIFLTEVVSNRHIQRGDDLRVDINVYQEFV